MTALGGSENAGLNNDIARASEPNATPVDTNPSGAAPTGAVPPGTTALGTALPASTPLASTPIVQSPLGFTALGTEPMGFMTLGAGPLGPVALMMAPPVVTEAALWILSTRLIRKDPTIRAMEAMRQATLAAHLKLQKEKDESAMRQACWMETMTNEHCRRPRSQPRSTTAALAARGHEINNDINNI